MSSQTAADNYQIIGLLFLSFEVFGKAVNKILKENSKPTASSWNIIFLQELCKKQTQTLLLILNSLGEPVRTWIRTSQAYCKPKLKSEPVIYFALVWEEYVYMSGTAGSALKSHITRVLFCLKVSAYIYAYSCVTAKSQLSKQAGYQTCWFGVGQS